MQPRQGSSWSTRLLIGLTLILIGAAAAVWGLARYDRAAQLLGVAPAPQRVRFMAAPPADQPAEQAQPGQQPSGSQLATLEARLARVENATQRVEGSAGRADALLVAFAARRAVDRGVALGYLETLLVDRFGSGHPRAVATIVTGSHAPVSLAELASDYEQLGPELRRGAPDEGLWAGFKREFSSVIEIRKASRPSVRPEARYSRALDMVRRGEVDAAIAETMRLPGAARANAWVGKARRYVSVQRALDEVESAALLAGNTVPR
ncbi:MAG TPA: hypothetical protein VFK50_06750 [Sphingomicrobium sp.]|nr:hypothetical protein [Sphingomicrobium sp.]